MVKPSKMGSAFNESNQKQLKQVLLRVKSKLTVLLMTIVCIMNFVKPQSNFTLSSEVLSGKSYFRSTVQGPEYEHFSICTSTTTCYVTKKTEVVWSSTSLNQAYPYSAPLYNKTMFAAYVSKIVDLNGTSVAERSVTPTRITKCLYTHGPMWVCQNGSTGNYFRYDVANEKSVLDYDTTINTKIQYITNQGCTIVDSANNTLFCAKLGTETNLIFKMNETKGGEFSAYSGSFEFPSNPLGCDYNNGYLMVYSNSPATMRIGKYDTGEMIVKWANSSLTGTTYTIGDVKTGLFIVPTTSDTYLYSAYNGTYIETITTNYEIEFSDVDPSFYYVQKTNNQYALRHVSTPNPVPNCKTFLAGVWRCGECTSGADVLVNETLAQ